jgi:hypothetical protein
MRPALRALLPDVTFRRSERLSQLKSFGTKSLKSLPPRSAVVAFSTERVYELAQSLRELRGGVAVVLGGLSPRTRNAQVAMFQAGEVQYLVATDAIGMGLNLDLERVAFAGLSKFDGFEQRALTVDELGQIAGRAGRHVRDGEFGTLSSIAALEPRVVSAIEGHRFPAVQRLIWRSVELDFGSPLALLDSLAAAPESELFTRVERADDFDALKALSHDVEVAALATTTQRVELLWDVCRIPDFRKGLLGEHVRIVKDVFLQLTGGHGRLREDWLQKQVAPLDDLKGDLHTLTARLEAIRTWTYISHRAAWVNDATQWQQKTRAIEDALGDALHQRLVERFVHKAAQAARWRRAPVAAASGPFAQLSRLVAPDSDAGEFVQRVVDARTAPLESNLQKAPPASARQQESSAAPRAAASPAQASSGTIGGSSGSHAAASGRTETPVDERTASSGASENVARVSVMPEAAGAADERPGVRPGASAVHQRSRRDGAAARDGRLHVDDLGRISFDGEVLGRLVRGADRLTPGVALLDAADWNGGERARLERRLSACARDVVSEAMGGFPADVLTADDRPPPLRALAFTFARGLGLVRTDAGVLEQVRLLDADSHRKLDALGVRQGSRYFVIEGAATPAAFERRAMLTSVFEDDVRPAGVPHRAVVGHEVMGGRDEAAYGYAWVGPVAVRVDALEGILASLSDPRRLASTFERLGVDAPTGAVVVKHLKRRP